MQLGRTVKCGPMARVGVPGDCGFNILRAWGSSRRNPSGGVSANPTMCIGIEEML